MIRAIELSRENVKSSRGGPFGAVIVKDGKIISEGVNSVTQNNDPTAHAEVSAIRKACEKLKTFDLTGTIIYTSCEPCPMCLSAIYWARISTIYYANTKKDAAKIQFDDQFIYDEISKNPDQRKIEMKQLMREEAHTVFKDWENSSNKILY